jgi:DNA primase
MDSARLATMEMAVSYSSSPDVKEQVRQAIDIVDLVGRHIPLRRQGRHYVGLCPWHDDSRPSLQVNPERQSWRCWVCAIGGDVFSFVMKMDGVSFPEALALLADQAGIPLRQKGTRPPSEGSDDKRRLLKAMAWAEQEYRECLLRSPEAEPARRYLQQRGISSESIDRFHLGFAPNQWDWIQRRAAQAGFTLKTLETVGLVVPSSEGKRPYDRFRGRVLFSIRDLQGRPVAFGGRVLPETGSTSPAKYINSPETPLFTKSNLVYGLDAARDAVRKGDALVRKGEVLVMEGYTDCIVAHQFGFRNAVAVLGTALGSRHVQILKRFADRIVLVLDGDEAGQKRTNEVLELFVAENVDLRIVTLPDNLDPCDFLQSRGAEAFRAILEEGAVDALEHAFRMATRGIDLVNDIHRASSALERLLGIVAKAPRLRADTTSEDRFREEKILQRLAASFRVREQDVRDRLTALRRHGRPQAAALPAGESASESAGGVGKSRVKIDPCDRELMELLLRFPDRVAEIRAAIRPEQVASPACRSIYEGICQLADDGAMPTFDRLMLELDDPSLKSLLVEFDESGSAKKMSDPVALLAEIAGSFRRREAARDLALAVSKVRESRPGQTPAVDWRQIEQLERARRGMSAPTDG